MSKAGMNNSAMKPDSSPYKKENRGHGPNDKRSSGNFAKPERQSPMTRDRDRSGRNDDSYDHSGHDKDKDATTGEKKFTGRCRLFVGNLTPDINEQEFRKMFEPYGEISEVYVNTSRVFGFIRLDYRHNAEAAKAALDGTQRKGRILRVRFATHGAALKVKNLHSHVSNELLEQSFSQFGELERCIVIVDDRGKSTGEGIVEFVRKPGANSALRRITEGVFLMGSDPKPVAVEPLEQKDEEDGMPEKFLTKTEQYKKEREKEPRFAPPGTFEYEFGMRWKHLEDLEKQRIEQAKKDTDKLRLELEEEMQNAFYDYQAEQIRQDLMRQQEELRRLEELRNSERLRRQQEMELRQQKEDRERAQQDERMMMRQQELSRGRGGMDGPGMRSREEMMMAERFADRMGDRMRDRMGDRMGQGGPGFNMWQEDKQRNEAQMKGMRGNEPPNRGRDMRGGPPGSQQMQQQGGGPQAGMERGGGGGGGPGPGPGPAQGGPGGPNGPNGPNAGGAGSGPGPAAQGQNHKDGPKPLMQPGSGFNMGGNQGNNAPANNQNEGNDANSLDSNNSDEVELEHKDGRLEEGKHCHGGNVEDSMESVNYPASPELLCPQDASPSPKWKGPAIDAIPKPPWSEPSQPDSPESSVPEPIESDVLENSQDTDDFALCPETEVKDKSLFFDMIPSCEEVPKLSEAISSSSKSDGVFNSEQDSAGLSLSPVADVGHVNPVNNGCHTDAFPNEDMDTDTNLVSCVIGPSQTEQMLPSPSLTEDDGKTGSDCNFFQHSLSCRNSDSGLSENISNNFQGHADAQVVHSPSTSNAIHTHNSGTSVTVTSTSSNCVSDTNCLTSSFRTVSSESLVETNNDFQPSPRSNTNQINCVALPTSVLSCQVSDKDGEENVDSISAENKPEMLNDCYDSSYISSYRQVLSGQSEEVDEGLEDCESNLRVVDPSVYQSYNNSVSSQYIPMEGVEEGEHWPDQPSSDEHISSDTSSQSALVCQEVAVPSSSSSSDTASLQTSSSHLPGQPVVVVVEEESCGDMAFCTGDQTVKPAKSSAPVCTTDTRASASVPQSSASSYPRTSLSGVSGSQPSMLSSSSTMHLAQHHGVATIMQHQTLRAGPSGGLAQATVLQKQTLPNGGQALVQQRTITNGGQTMLVQQHTMTNGLGGLTQQTVVQQRVIPNVAQAQAAQAQAAQAQAQAAQAQAQAAALHASALRQHVMATQQVAQASAMQQQSMRLAQVVSGNSVYQAPTLARRTVLHRAAGGSAILGPRLVQASTTAQGSMMQRLVRQRYLGGPVLHPVRGVHMLAGRPIRVKMTYPNEQAPG